ncbi:Dynein heavy chain-like protein [Pseudocercospora fuligena]|uniref:Dynein heavy chain-like protein n=1 Tax=Pseudocercospora fuligena TaxID=685502 RepID=A0A8H6RKE5_9PEZI|nr:Dynein heavy chain-like protein [Pseudocercospora fuligena]
MPEIPILEILLKTASPLLPLLRKYNRLPSALPQIKPEYPPSVLTKEAESSPQNKKFKRLMTIPNEREKELDRQDNEDGFEQVAIHEGAEEVSEDEEVGNKEVGIEEVGIEEVGNQEVEEEEAEEQMVGNEEVEEEQVEDGQVVEEIEEEQVEEEAKEDKVEDKIEEEVEEDEVEEDKVEVEEDKVEEEVATRFRRLNMFENDDLMLEYLCNLFSLGQNAYILFRFSKALLAKCDLQKRLSTAMHDSRTTMHHSRWLSNPNLSGPWSGLGDIRPHVFTIWAGVYFPARMPTP